MTRSARFLLLALTAPGFLGACDEPVSSRPAPAAVSKDGSSSAEPAPSATAKPPTTAAAHTPPSASAAATSTAAPTSTATSTASAAPATSGEAEPNSKKPTCLEGAYLHENPPFCILVPDGYTPARTKTGGLIDGVLFQSKKKGTMDLQVTWLKKPRSVYRDERKKMKEAAKGDSKAVIGRTLDGKGLYVRFKSEMGGKEFKKGDSVVFKKGTIFWCKASAFTDPPPPRGFLTACQTLLAK